MYLKFNLLQVVYCHLFCNLPIKLHQFEAFSLNNLSKNQGSLFLKQNNLHISL